MRVLLALLLVATTPVKPKPIVLHERGEQIMVCAEYTVPSDPRRPNRSCVDAAQVRAWILQNGRPADECER